MTAHNKRRFIRMDSLNLLDYLVLEADGSHGRYSMGRTLDVSVDGIRLETVQPLRPGTHLLITLGLEENLVDIEGEVVHCRPRRNRFLSGVTFWRVEKADRHILDQYINAFLKYRETAGELEWDI
ncbi:MAG: PilZ domain-containing protein [Desulfobulbaceae bacterium]|jgi:hypothetical protein|nr:PilZ domain-containing protein [Desulfobulbaceae bacterium]